MTLPEFGDLLAAAYPNTYHYSAANTAGGYAVWQEYESRRQAGGPLVVVSIQVDLFTKEEFDPALTCILAALNAARVAYEAPWTVYDADTGYIHHVIECEIITGQAERTE